MIALRDSGGMVPENFLQVIVLVEGYLHSESLYCHHLLSLQELYKWALESVAVLALNTRLGCLQPDLPKVPE